VLAAGRKRAFSPFDAWAPVLRTPGVTFINLQYGDCEAELTMAVNGTASRSCTHRAST
jgi:hypothetical protein